jgi:hypothetical protein
VKNIDSNQIAPTVIRTILYCLLVAGTSLLLIKVAATPDSPGTFKESSIIEWLQLAYLGTCTLLFILSAKIASPRASLSVLLAGLALSASARELDFFFDNYVFDGAWQAAVLIIATVTGTLVFRSRQNLKPAIREFISKASFGYMTSAFFTLFVFSRLIGKQVLWQSIMAENYIRAVKNFVEESTELFGYTLLLIAAIEFYRETRKAIAYTQDTSH